MYVNKIISSGTISQYEQSQCAKKYDWLSTILYVLFYTFSTYTQHRKSVHCINGQNI